MSRFKPLFRKSKAVLLRQNCKGSIPREEFRCVQFKSSWNPFRKSLSDAALKVENQLRFLIVGDKESAKDKNPLIRVSKVAARVARFVNVDVEHVGVP